MKKEFNLDIVYVIDATNGGAILTNVKHQIAEYAEKLKAYCAEKLFPVDKLREKLVFFGDFATEGDAAIIETEFYDAATNKADFLAQLNRNDIRMSGGDLPENALEALYVAMNSDWFKIDWSKGVHGRHIIVLVSDAYPLKLQERDGAIGYDGEKYPSDVQRLQDIWDKAGSPETEIPMSEFKRLMLFVPDGDDGQGHTWEDVMGWECTCAIIIGDSHNDVCVDLCHENFFGEIIRDNYFSYQYRAAPAAEDKKPAVKPKVEDKKPAVKPKVEDKKPEEEEIDENPSDGYVVDIALAVDATGSMGPCIAMLKEQAKSLDEALFEMFENAGKKIDKLRIRLIDFADFATEGDDAIYTTDFLTMPQEKDKFIKALDGIKYLYRGGDIPENALEALFIAMNSDWTPLKKGQKGRHIIILMTDAYPLRLRERAGCMGYCEDDYPIDTAGLKDVWDTAGTQEATVSLSGKNKRLILFAPSGDDGDGHTWNDVAAWGNAVFFDVEPSNGLNDVDLIESLKKAWKA